MKVAVSASPGAGLGESRPSPTRSPPTRSPWWGGIEFVLIAITGTMLWSLGDRVLATIAQASAWWPLTVTLGVAAGVLSADFSSGTLHWFCDRFFRRDTPLLGRMLIQPFRDHHVDPQGIVRHGLLELHGNSCIPVVAVLSLARWADLPDPGRPGSCLVQVWLFAFAFSSLLTNQFHLWAHAGKVPAGVRWLQRRGLILTPTRHAVHHRGGFSRSYCVTTGWMNPLLDRIEFFPRIERAIRALGRWQN